MESAERKESGVTLQKTSESDIPTLMEIEKSVANSNIYSPMLEESEWRDEMQDNEVYLIKSEGDVVGNISCQKKESDEMYISGLVVMPSHQGKGIARAALDHVLKNYPNARRVELVTHPDNPALKLYQSMGFQVESQKDNYYDDGEPRLILALSR